MYNNIVTKNKETLNSDNSIESIKNLYIQSHKIEVLCTHKTKTGQIKPNPIAKNCFIYIFKKIKKIKGNTVRINFFDLQRYCNGKDRSTINRALMYLEERNLIKKHFKRFFKEGKFVTEIFITINVNVLQEITNSNTSETNDSSMLQNSIINRQNTNKENIAIIENESSLNEKKYEDVEKVLSYYNLSKKIIDRLSSEISTLIESRNLKFENKFALKRYVDKIILSLKENAMSWNGCVDVLSFSYKMNDIRLKPDLIEEINDELSRKVPDWLYIKLMDKLSDGKGFRDRSSFVKYMVRVFQNEKRFSSDGLEYKSNIYDEFDFIITGDCNKAKKVLEKVDNVSNARRNEVSLLCNAARNGHAKIVNMLIEKGCDINQRFRNGYNALFAAVTSNKLDVVRLLVENGADVNAKLDYGENVLIFGLQEGLNNTDMIDYLLALGIDINYMDKYDFTALSIAIKYSNAKVVRFLLNKVVLRRDNYGAAVEFYYAVDNDKFDMADLIVEHDKKTRDLINNEVLSYNGCHPKLKKYYKSRNITNNEISLHYQGKLLEIYYPDYYPDTDKILECIRVKNHEDFKYYNTKCLRIVKNDKKFHVKATDYRDKERILSYHKDAFDTLIGQGNWEITCYEERGY